MEIAEIIFKALKNKEISENIASEILKLSKKNNDTLVQDIAIIGIAARFPGADNINEYWDNICLGQCSISDYPVERERDSDPFVRHFSSLKESKFKYSKGGYLQDIDKFDYEFFKISPAEACLMDPNQRLFLQTACSALEDAGLSKDKIKKSKTGVYLGYANAPLYSQLISKQFPDYYQMSVAGNVSSIIASRISYMMDLRGPSMLIDTACSSSLVATHIACQALLNGECEMAISGGVKINLVPVEGGLQIGIESSCGVTKTFDDSSTGTVWGEGVAAIILKPLKQAVADGDQIYAVIKGSAVNQDGASIGITAPNKKAQTEAICMAWKAARIDPETISYIEAHGTGTQLGDTVEIEALSEAFAKYTYNKQFCAIGSVKTNIGHLDTMSGMAGLIKSILSLKNGLIPPMLHLHKPNKKIPFINSPVYICDSLKPCDDKKYPLRYGISSFGFSGTNCHLVLEQAPKLENNVTSFVYQILTVSANSSEQLLILAKNYLNDIENTDEKNIENLCYTSNVGRNHYQYRLAIISKSKSELISKLSSAIHSKISNKVAENIFYGRHRIVSSNRPDKEQGDLTEDEKELLDKEAEKYILDKNFADDFPILEKICTLYIKGSDIKWIKLYENKKMHITPLTTYPYKKNRCWLQIAENVASEIQDTDKKSWNKLSALIDECILDTEAKVVFQTHFSAEDYWVLTDHRVQGKCFLAGTVYIEMILEAMKVVEPEQRVELKNVVLLTPFELYEYEERKVYTVIYRKDNHYTFEIKSNYEVENINQEVVHSQGEIRYLNHEIEQNKENISTLKENCNMGYFIPDVDNYNDLSMMSFGAHWKNIKEMYIGENETLSLLELPSRFIEEINQFIMHPALLDNALATQIKTDGNAYLPFSYEEIIVYRSMPSKVYSHVRSVTQKKQTDEILVYDITLLDELGNRIIEIVHSSRKKLHKSPFKVNKYHSIIWCKDVSDKSEEKFDFRGEKILCFSNGKRLEKQIIEYFAKCGHQIIDIQLSDNNIKISNNKYHFRGGKEDYSWLLKNFMGDNLTIIYLLSIFEDIVCDINELNKRLKVGVNGMFHLYQSLCNYNEHNKIKICAVTNYAFSINKTERKILPENSALAGLSKVITQESPLMESRVIDIDDHIDSSILIKELEYKNSKPIVAYRNNKKYVEKIVNVSLDGNTEKNSIKDDGCYVITGGLGGVGLEIAKSISSKNKVDIVLVGRTEIPDKEEWKNIAERHSIDKSGKIIRELLEIEKSGSFVSYYSKDISLEYEVKELFAEIKCNHKTLKGIIHCAAVAGNGMLLNKPEEAFLNVLQPKIHGTWLLDQYSREMNPDFLILFSSGVSITGLAGQGDYTAANSYLDAYTNFRNQLGMSTTSINWTAWREVGMAVDNNVNVDDAILKAMTTKEALNTFEKVFREGIDRVIVGEFNFEYEIFRNTKYLNLELEEEILSEILEYNKRKNIKEKIETNEEINEEITMQGRMDNNYTNMEKDISIIFAKILGLRKINIFDNFYELGGDSLIALKIINEVNSKLKTSAVITDLFNHITVEEFSKYMDQNFTQIKSHNTLELFSIEQTIKSDKYELSSAQMRMYVLNQLEGETTSYNISKAFKIKGILEITRMEEVFRTIISRHETLRTSFYIEDDSVVQKVEKNVKFKIDYFECEKQQISKIIKEYIRPFNLEIAPLLRLAIIKFNSNDYVMLFDIHHIIADGYSLDVLINEVVTLYEGSELPKLKIQYRDFVKWQKNFIASDYVKKQEDYWLKIYEKEFEPLELPLVYPRPAVQDYSGDEYLLNLGNDIVAKIKNMSIEYKITPFVIMLSCYYVLLAKYTHQSDIIVGIPVVGRPNQNLTSLVGMFVNTLALRNEVKNSTSFLDFLMQIKANCNAAYENQDYQFDSLVNKVSKDRNLSRSSMLSTIFNMNNIRNAEIKMQDIILEDYDLTSSACTTDILFHCIESGDGMILGFRYQTSLFSKKFIEDFANAYCHILKQTYENPQILISKIRLLTQEKEKMMLTKFSKSKDVKLKNETVLNKIQNLASQNENSLGKIQDNKDAFTYKQIDLLSDDLAFEISAKTKDKIIGVIVCPSVNFVIAILAIWKAKAAFLPIDFDTPKERIRFIMDDVKSNTIIIDNHSDIIDSGYLLINVQNDREHRKNVFLKSEVCPCDMAYAIYTSGTTGVPKGITITHENLYNYVQWINKKIKITKEDSTLIVSSLCFDLSYTSLFSALSIGANLFFTDKITYQEPKQLLQHLSDKKISFLKMSPSLFGLVVNSAEFNNTKLHLRLIILGGEKIVVQDVKKYHNLYCETEFINHYGPTETTIGTIAHRINCTKLEEYELHPVIGRPIDNARVYILDEDGHIVPEYVYGKIHVAGKGVGKYINSDFSEKKVFTERVFFGSKELLYNTGDRARFLANGNIEFKGRDDCQIKIKGFRVDLLEIQRCLEMNPAIEKAVVLTKKNSKEKSRIVAYLVLNCKINVCEIRKGLMRYLPEYMFPSEYVDVEQIPLTANNKIDTIELLKKESKISTGKAFVEPKGELEELVAEIWEKVLKIQNISATDNFFELGGDSIAAVHVTAQLSKYKVNLKDVFQYPTISDISKRLVLNNYDINQDPVSGKIALTPIQLDFFAQNYEDSNYWNQANILFSPQGFDETLVHKAFAALVAHHDALRIIFKDDNGKKVQINKGTNEIDFNISTFIAEADAPKKIIEQYANEIQHTMNLEIGPLFNCSIFKTASGDYLLIIIHHLIIDAVSWQIILEDFKVLYNSLIFGREVSLSPKTNSVMEWSNFLRKYANSYDIKSQYGYWRNIAQKNFSNLPKDFNGGNKQKDMQVSTISFSKKETSLISQFVNTYFDISVRDVLLSAFIFAIKEWCGNNEVLLSLEGHGRNISSQEINISRTVGWFTATYPVFFDLENIDDPYAQLIITKEVLDNIPEFENGYQILKYLSEDNQSQQSLNINPEISFNYYGKLDYHNENEGNIRLSSITLKNTRSGNSERRYILDIISIIQGGNLLFSIGYSSLQYKYTTIDNILKIFKKNILDLISQVYTSKGKNKAVINDEIIPFNDIYYHDCLFNAFFPIVSAVGGDIRCLLANDISLYKYDSNLQRIESDLFQVKSISNALYDNYKMLVKIKIRTSNIIDEVISAIDNKNYIIVHIDCYYENIREDMYHKSHWTHAILIYGYDKVKKEVYILEHDDINSLSYTRKVLKFEVLLECFGGYINNFQKGLSTPLFYVIDSLSYENCVYNSNFAFIFRTNVMGNKDRIQASINNLELFINYYETIVYNSGYIYQNIDFLVKEFNDIVKHKSADNYKFKCLFNSEYEIIQISTDILNNWSFIRAIVQKLKYSGQYRKTSFGKTVIKIKEILQLEKTLYNLLKF